MGFLLLVLFIAFIVWPLWRLWRVMGAFKKRQQDIINEMFGVGRDAASKEEDPSRRRGGWSRPGKHRKKIDPEVGEYVKFHEVRIETNESHTSTFTDGSETKFTETQIEDVEWIDLPPEDKSESNR